VRCSFFRESEGQEHLFDVQDMAVPNVGEHVWINALGPNARISLPEDLSGHMRLIVTQRSFSLTIIDKWSITPHAEVMVKLDK
jgi:hypothetical protein